MSRRADRNFHDWGPALCDALNGLTIDGYPEHRVFVKYATEHRCGVVISGPNLSDQITGTDPLKDNLPLITCKPTSESDKSPAKMTSELLMALHAQFHRILSQHPLNLERSKRGLAQANCLLFRGCSKLLQSITPFSQRHPELCRAFAVAPTCMIAGWTRTIGIETHRLIPDGYNDASNMQQEDASKYPGVTGDMETNLDSKRRKVFDLLNDQKADYKFGFMHIKVFYVSIVLIISQHLLGPG